MGSTVAISVYGIGAAQLCLRTHCTRQTSIQRHARRRDSRVARKVRTRGWPSGLVYSPIAFVRSSNLKPAVLNGDHYDSGYSGIAQWNSRDTAGSASGY